MKRTNVSTGAKWEPLAGYSRAVRVGDWVAVTGTTAIDDQGRPVGEDDPYAQTRQIFRNVARALEAVGASLSDVVRTRMFVTRMQDDWEEIARGHKEAMGDVRPATSMIEAAGLIEPWMRVEIEVDAIVGATEVREVTTRPAPAE